MDFTELSYPDAPRIRITPPGPESRKYLDYQSATESSAVSYSRGMPMALFRALSKAALAEDRAEVIVLGCAGLAGMDKALQRSLGVPVLEGLHAL